jgi:hypothetical protein
MPKVQMLTHITGGRADGTVWPNAGEPLKVSEAEARDLYMAQVARPWPGDPDPEPEPEPGPTEAEVNDAAAATVTEAIQQGGELSVESAPDETADDEPEPDETADQAVPPRPAASKAEWSAWCVRNGATEEWVESATKQQMMENYGARP